MITVYAATSLDSYLATQNNGLEWLESVGKGGPDGDYGYSAFYSSTDIIVMGRKTYDVCLGFKEWPYLKKECWVLTRQSGLQSRYGEHFSIFKPEQWKVIGKEKHVYVSGGGETVRLFLKQGNVDKLVLSVIPVLLGAGLPLFPPGFPRSSWKLTSSESYPSGLVQSSYVKS